MSVAGKTILIISGGREALPIIEKAIAMGLHVIVSDGDEKAPGLALAHEAMLSSTYDAEKSLRLARAMHSVSPIDGVLSAAADVPLTVATVAEGLGLPGPSIESARLASDKFLMKEAMRGAGVPVPWYSMVMGPMELKKIIFERKKTLVIKPVDSRGARGVIRLTGGVDPSWAFFEAEKNSPSGRVMAEEWVEGLQISTESVLTGGVVATPGLSERNYEYIERFSPYVIENGGDLPARLTDDERKAVDKVIGRVGRALGIDDWTIKGDIVMGDCGPVVIEAAPRLSGGFFCTHTIPLSLGVDIVEAAILLALGVKVRAGDYRPWKSRFVSQRFWFPGPGVVRSIRIPPHIKMMPGLEEMEINVKPGDTLGPVVSHPGRAGMVITTGVTPEEASMRAREAIEGVDFTVEGRLRMVQ